MKRFGWRMTAVRAEGGRRHDGRFRVGTCCAYTGKLRKQLLELIVAGLRERVCTSGYEQLPVGFNVHPWSGHAAWLAGTRSPRPPGYELSRRRKWIGWEIRREPRLASTLMVENAMTVGRQTGSCTLHHPNRRLRKILVAQRCVRELEYYMIDH
jgi:hypothetical protein